MAKVLSQDMEDELEEDFEVERSLNTDDFDEHADDMEDLEDLTPEEVDGRHIICVELYVDNITYDMNMIRLMTSI